MKLISFSLIIIFSYITNAFANNYDNIEILKYMDQGNYENVVKIYSKYKNKFEYNDLMNIAASIYYLQLNTSKIAKNINLNFAEKLFVEAYIAMLGGNIKISKQLFNRLIDENISYIYGTIGLLEISIFTDNILEMRRIIGDFKEKNIDDAQAREILFYYNVIYKYNILDYDKLYENISSFQNDNEVKNIHLELIRLELMVNNNKYKEALDRVDILIKEFGNLQDLILLKYHILKIIKGNDNALLFLRSYDDDKLWKIRSVILFSELDSRQNTLEDIGKLTSQLKNNIPYVLIVSNMLIDYNYLNNAGDTSNFFYKNVDYPDFFMLSNLFLSKFYYSTNNILYKEYFDKANIQSPYNEYLLWFKYIININNSEYSSAMEVLNLLLLKNKLNIEILSLKADILYKMNKYEEFIQLYEDINSLNIFIPKETADNLEKFYKLSRKSLNR